MSPGLSQQFPALLMACLALTTDPEYTATIIPDRYQLHRGGFVCYITSTPGQFMALKR
jgi:hypothetical protein